MQVTQSIYRDPRRPKGHAGAYAGIQHPIRQRRYDTWLNLNMNDSTRGALLAVMCVGTSTVEGMPAIVNFNFTPDMGRMNA